jgi:hypothetical protein
MADSNVVTWEPESQVEEKVPLPEWNGQRTIIRIAVPMLRGGYDPDGHPTAPVVVGGGTQPDPVEFRASYDRPSKRWVGPEAPLVEQLYQQGAIADTPPNDSRNARSNAIEHQRGAWPTADGQPALRPELRQRTKEMVTEEWARVLSGGLEELKRLEAQERRADREENAGAIRELAAAVRESNGGGRGNVLMEKLAQLAEQQPEALETVLNQMLEQPAERGDWAGASGPAAHPAGRRRQRAQQQPEEDQSAVSDEES